MLTFTVNLEEESGDFNELTTPSNNITSDHNTDDSDSSTSTSDLSNDDDSVSGCSKDTLSNSDLDSIALNCDDSSVCNYSSSADDEIPSDSNDDELSCDANNYVDSSASLSFDHQFSVALLSIMDKHSLSYSCVANLLKLFKVTVPNFSLCSVHTLLNKFTNFKESTGIHHCCGFCAKLLRSDTKCTKSDCLAKGLPDSSFIEVRLDYLLVS